MNASIFKSTIRFAMSRKKHSQKFAYLMKGIIFAPFLAQASRKTTKGNSAASAANQSCDDIYPLF